MKLKIRLDTMKEVQEFVTIASTCNGKVTITDNNGLMVNAKSLLGVLYSLEFNELWCESEEDIFSHINKFAVYE